MLSLVFMLACSKDKTPIVDDSGLPTEEETSWVSSTNDWTSVGTGDEHSCGINTEGKAVCWGCELPDESNTYWYVHPERCNPPEGSYSGMSLWSDINCLQEESTFSCWTGSYYWTDGEIPTVDIKQVSAGAYHVCTLNTLGMVGCWGAGPLDIDEFGIEFNKISAGKIRTCGLTIAGDVFCWGTYRTEDLLIEGPIIDVSYGYYHVCYIREGGSLECIEDGAHWDLPDGQFQKVVSGSGFSCGLLLDGSISCWGEDYPVVRDTPDSIFQTIDAGEYHACGVRDDGYIECWGYPYEGQSYPP